MNELIHEENFLEDKTIRVEEEEKDILKKSLIDLDSLYDNLYDNSYKFNWSPQIVNYPSATISSIYTGFSPSKVLGSYSFPTKTYHTKIKYQIIKNYKSIKDCHDLITTINCVQDLCEYIENIDIKKNSDDETFNFILNYGIESNNNLEKIYERSQLLLNLKSL